ncbi:ABC transporter ATP-binding protein [Halocatena marina]|uniref:ABC transporter ATP-binding protein n=1 Tax=Halocatena marina TaxID=2934937 RepID=UPI00200CA959|nr:ABC transporter ATP-binding protein [Halocatena marina]
MGRLAISDLTKTFGETTPVIAVDDVSLEIDDGEFLVLVGPSGCGKSTTLRCIAGLERVTEGEVLVDNEEVTNNKPKDRNMAMVFQNYALYPHMTAQENISFGLKMTTNLSEEEVSERVSHTADMMNVIDILDKKPGQLSGGQQQRIALGRAIVRDPEVFLMDEPLSNLDAKLRGKMRTQLQELQSTLDVTTIYVTHDQTEAMTMGDRIAILESGKLQQVGTPLECYHEPANQFVAGFIGSPSMNFFDVNVSRDEDNTVLRHNDFEYQVSSELAKTVNHHERLVLGIRPSDISLAESTTEQTISATVNVTEPLGDLTYVYLEIGDNQATVSVDGEFLIDSGADVDLEFLEKKIHIFEHSSGKAIKNRGINDDENQQIRI